jgi:Methyltransferase domain
LDYKQKGVELFTGAVMITFTRMRIFLASSLLLVFLLRSSNLNPIVQCSEKTREDWKNVNPDEDFGCQIYAFDPSMDMKDSNYTANIHFYQMGISDHDTDQGPNGWKMRSLDSIYKMLEAKHGPEAVIDYLKIDIEGAEWHTLPQMLRTGMFDKVKQLGVEVHYWAYSSFEEYRNGVKVLKSLEDYGFVRFSSRVNIWMKSHIAILQREDYNGYELTWYNQKFKN